MKIKIARTIAYYSYELFAYVILKITFHVFQGFWCFLAWAWVTSSDQNVHHQREHRHETVTPLINCDVKNNLIKLRTLQWGNVSLNKKNPP